MPYEYTTVFTYNSKGQLLTIDGPVSGSGDTTAFSYGPQTGAITAHTLPLIGTTHYADHDDAGNPLSVTDVNGNAETRVYDGRNRLARIERHADGSTRSVAFTADGLPRTVTDEDGVTRTYEYDPVYGRLAKITDHEGNYILYDYDAQGNLVETGYYYLAGNLTHRKRWDYQSPDIPGKLWKRIRHDDRFTEYEYDGAGNVAAIVDPENDRVEYGYDESGRLVAVTRPGGVQTTLKYDRYGNAVSVTDPGLLETTYGYDDMSRLISIVSPDSGQATFVYDEAGNPVRKTDARGITTLYQYDDAYRRVAAEFPAHGARPAFSIAYAYDTYADPGRSGGKGRLTGMSDASGTTVFDYTFYDSQGIITKTATMDGLSFTFEQTRSPGGRLLSMTYPSGRIALYDRGGCFCNVDAVRTRFLGQTAAVAEGVAYRPFGSASAMTIGATRTVGNQFDLSGNVYASNPGGAKARGYTHYPDGRLESVASAATPWDDQFFGYDTLNRLTDAVGAYGTLHFEYDGAGNRLQTTADGMTTDYTYAEGTNRLQAVEPEWADALPYEYDDNGNTIRIGTLVLDYNQDNRLVNAGDAEYVYNGFGQRAIKRSGGTTTYFNYDLEGRLVSESTSAAAVSYIHLGKNPLAKADESTGEAWYYHNDLVGAPDYMTDAAGDIVWGGVWRKPFGQVAVNPPSTVENNLRFQGQYYDQETGLHYNWHRYYDPKTGRYLTPDPIGLAGGINPYVYVENDPVNMIDPEGLWVAQAIGGTMGMAYGVYSAHQNNTSMLQGALIGGLTGVLSTIPIPGLSGATSGALMGALSGGLGNVAGQLADSTPCSQEFNWSSFGKSIAAGTVGGAIGGGMANARINQVLQGSFLNSMRKNPIFTPFGQDVISATTGGVAAGGIDAAIQ